MRSGMSVSTFAVVARSSWPLVMSNWLHRKTQQFGTLSKHWIKSLRELKKESGNSKLGVFIRVDSCPFVVVSSLFEDLVFNVFDTDSDAKREFHHEGLEAHEDRNEVKTLRLCDLA